MVDDHSRKVEKQISPERNEIGLSRFALFILVITGELKRTHENSLTSSKVWLQFTGLLPYSNATLETKTLITMGLLGTPRAHLNHTNRTQ